LTDELDSDRVKLNLRAGHISRSEVFHLPVIVRTHTRNRQIAVPIPQRGRTR